MTHKWLLYAFTLIATLAWLSGFYTAKQLYEFDLFRKNCLIDHYRNFWVPLKGGRK